MIWVLVTNSNSCRIFTYQKSPAKLTLIMNANDRDARLKDSELVSDKPGKYKADGNKHGSFVPETDPKENEIDMFARKIAQELEHARKTNLFNQLIVIAPAQMSGKLFGHLSPQTKELMSNNIQKDIPHMPEHELLDFLHINAQYRDNA